MEFAGTAEPGATIQIFLNGKDAMTKRVTSAGKFSFSLDAEEEGVYEAVLAFGQEKPGGPAVHLHVHTRMERRGHDGLS